MPLGPVMAEYVVVHCEWEISRLCTEPLRHVLIKTTISAAVVMAVLDMEPLLRTTQRILVKRIDLSSNFCTRRWPRSDTYGDDEWPALSWPVAFFYSTWCGKLLVTRFDFFYKQHQSRHNTCKISFSGWVYCNEGWSVHPVRFVLQIDQFFFVHAL